MSTPRIRGRTPASEGTARGYVPARIGWPAGRLLRSTSDGIGIAVTL
ncbi:hypothetical protein AB0H83_12230 [Dactylosporangium sp. NPDC050688]